MIKIKQSKRNFEYDIQALTRAFYPKEEIILNSEDNKEAQLYIEIELQEKEIIIFFYLNKDKTFKETASADWTQKSEYRNILKRLLYKGYKEITKKELLWGTLTGVRPTKLVLEKLEKEESEEVIRHYMKETFFCSEEKIDTSIQIAKRELQLLKDIDYKNGYSLYIGIPFCPSKCLYCSFPSFPLRECQNQVKPYLDALSKEIDYAATCFYDKKLISIYIGGGTPTSLDAEQLQWLLQKVRKSFRFTDIKEFTVEAGRPDSLTEEKLRIIKEQNVTRISINPQSMKQATLDLIGRKHTIEQVYQTFAMARKVGHDNINMDLIIGLPTETKEDVKETLNKIKEILPDSLTMHTLALKRASNLTIYQEKYDPIVPIGIKEMFDEATNFAKLQGYHPYYLYRQKKMTENLENIGFAKKGKEGIYNILIMEEKHTILALGAGAASKFVFQDGTGLERVENVKNIKDYIERIEEMIQRKKDFLKRGKDILFSR